ncbi:hypothetical protein IV203_013147 [Nitzschia inconspicua]|uniref:Uncharacterized protein n=1 Tax=Nitzschia inconspicua TaxID=303405 RepID=A0A9K3Q780_9STRA|nr:hypothetical protein IV203_013147 [Nitzschia inconspicua]
MIAKADRNLKLRTWGLRFLSCFLFFIASLAAVEPLSETFGGCILDPLKKDFCRIVLFATLSAAVLTILVAIFALFPFSLLGVVGLVAIGGAAYWARQCSISRAPITQPSLPNTKPDGLTTVANSQEESKPIEDTVEVDQSSTSDINPHDSDPEASASSHPNPYVTTTHWTTSEQFVPASTATSICTGDTTEDVDIDLSSIPKTTILQQ